MKLGSTLTLVCVASLATVSTQRASGQNTPSLDAVRFREIGPVSMSGRVVDLAVVDQDPTVFYVAASTGGVWKTTNHGVTFDVVFSNEGTHSVGDIAVHQRDTNIVWVGTGERANRQSSSWGDGVYKSTDGGRSWQHKGLRDSHHIGRIVMDPNNPNTVYVAALGHLWGPNDERGLYRSTNGGDTWERVLSVDEHTGVTDVAIDPQNPNILYAASYQRRRRPYGFNGGGPGSALWKSEDAGTTWRKLSRGLPPGEYGRIGISIYPPDPRIVVVSIEQGWQYNASTAYGERRAGVYRSEDAGETWTHMSDWNPRPMYASQPLFDPSNHQRIYMQNAFSVSEDGGKTFRSIRQSLHGDDRFLWVNPNDSRHVIKADDGGVGISYDRANTWLYLRHLPISQYYRVGVDMRDPYWIYGGLQDNGSWAGPNATYRSEGILFDDWIKTGGGDGFVNLIDTTDNRTLYTESQYLGLSRLDLVTRERKTIRPDDARGAISPRRNWDAWGPGVPEPELGNAMAPGNWDGPFIISPHDANTLYAGLDRLWKSTNRGDTWSDLGDLTTGVNRRDLTIMGVRAHDSTLSLDDGIPYFPTLSAIAESPLQQGLLYVGTDDGNVQVSPDGGRTWQNVSDRLPSLPDMSWINGIETSHHNMGTAFVVANNYRNDDFANYLYKTTDAGRTWTSITGNLPANRVLRTIREDLRNPNVLFLGTEFGLYYTYNGGQTWMEVTANLPMVAVNDLVIHPRDNDLVLGTHGRGIWILDQINFLQEMSPAVASAPLHLFTIEPAYSIRYAGDRGHTGDMIFHGTNPPAGAIIDFHLGTPVREVTLSIADPAGRVVRREMLDTSPGLNRTTWDLRGQPLTIGGEDGSRPRFRLEAPWVPAGQYTVRISAGNSTAEQTVTVRDDPRIDVSETEQREWRNALQRIAQRTITHARLTDSLEQLQERLDDMALNATTRSEVAADLDEVLPLAEELRRRMNGLYNRVIDWTGRPTTDQMSQLDYFTDWANRLAGRAQQILTRTR